MEGKDKVSVKQLEEEERLARLDRIENGPPIGILPNGELNLASEDKKEPVIIPGDDPDDISDLNAYD